MDWENLRHFAALVEAGTLSGAARQLAVEHATVGRRVAALEAELGLKLVDRRGRRVTLTEAGERIAGLAGRMDETARGVHRAAAGARPGMAGDVTISAPPALAALLLAEPLVALRRAHPELVLRLLGEQHRASLDRHEADIAIRLSRPAEGDLSIARLGSMAFRLYATPAYLAATAPADWSFIGFDEAMWQTPQHIALERIAAGRRIGMLASTTEIQHAACRADGGIALLPEFITKGDQTLVDAAPDAAALRRDVWLVVHNDVRMAPAIRLVMQHLREGLAPHLAD